MLSPREIAEEIERNAGFLATDARDVPERHRSLQAVFEHSWRLLNAEERQGLQRLAVFHGGFGRDAADQVAQASLALLSSLVSRSLVRRSEAAGAGRYDLHELVRQFAAGKLAEDPAEAEAANERHCEFYTRLLAANEPRFKSARQMEALAELSQEADNLRQAWGWAVSHARQPALWRAGRGLQWFYDLRGWLPEGVRLLRAAAEMAARQGPGPEAADWLSTQSLLLTYQALSQVRSGQVAQGRAGLQQSEALARSLGSGPVLTDALALLGLADYLSGDYAAAQAHLTEALAASQATGYHWSSAFCLMILGMVAQAQGAPDAAQDHYEASLAAWRAIGSPRNTASCLIIYSSLVSQQQHMAEAERMLREALALSRSTNDPWSTAIALDHWSAVVRPQGAAGRAEAARMLQESVELLHHMGDRWGMTQALTHLGELAVEAGAWPDAQRHFEAAVQTARQGDLPPLMLEALAALAELHAQAGPPALALQLAGWISAHPAATTQLRVRAEALRTACETKLTAGEREGVLSRVRGSTVDDWIKSLARN